MSKVLKFMKERSKSRGKQRGKVNDEQSNSTASPPDESPRSVAGSSVEGLFSRNRRSSTAAIFDQEPITVPISADGSIIRGRGATNTNPFEEEAGVKDRSVVPVVAREDFDLTEEPSEGDYEDFGHDSSFHDFQQSASSFHRSTMSNNSNNSDHHLYEFNNNHSSHSRGGDLDVGAGSSGDHKYQRSKSVQRPMQENSVTVRGPTLEDINKGSNKKRRSKSTGRSERRDQITAATLKNYESNKLSKSSNDININEEPKRKSKMEKILQLQEKNQRYKDEFRKVQKDRKALKKEVEIKKLETAALTKEIDTHIAETSILKMKLSEALQQLDRIDFDERKDKSAITKLQKELSAVRGDYNSAVARVARMREEVESMKLVVNSKDEEIKALTEEISEQAALVDSLHMEIIAIKKDEGYVAVNGGLEELKEENERLKAELGSTLQRASSMVKEREEAIADLLKENEEIKRMLTAREESDDNHIEHEEFLQLRTELSAAAAALEESQDRNVVLEEEVDAWIAKGEEMESEIQRLRDDVEAWQRKAVAAERSMAVVETSAQESAKKAITAEAALAEAERKYKEHLQEQERRHTEALLDQKEKMAQQHAAAKDSAAPPNPQEMMLQKAVADLKAKEAAKGGSWGSVIQRVRGNGDAEEELSADQKRIRELETVNADQENEISKVKSEMVRMRSTYNDTMYTNKKRIEQLEQENQEYAAKQQAMELELAELKKSLASVPKSGSSVASF